MQRSEPGASSIVDELLNLSAARHLLADLHGGQKRFIWAKDTEGHLADMVALLSGRRFGKTEAILRLAVALCLVTPFASVLYVSMQRTSARSIAWPLLQSLARRYNLRIRKADERELYVEFLNGARIQLVGADHPKFARLLLGTQHDLVLVDEAQDFIYIDLKYLVDEVLGATTDDREGRMFLTGTPGPVESGYFWEVVVDRKWPEWTVVSGHAFENPYTAAQQRKKLEKLKRLNPAIENEPWIRRRFFGEWVPDNRDRVVTLRPELNYLYEWAPAPDEEFVLSIDFGFTAPSAYVLSAWNPRRHNDYVFLEGWERKSMMLADHLAACRSYMNDPVIGRRLWIQGDPGGNSKALTEELRITYNIPIHDVDKNVARHTSSGELGLGLVVAQLNMDASTGRLKVYNRLDPAHPELNGVAQQWNTLGYVVEPLTRKRKIGEPRHKHDAAVYCRRRMRPEIFEEHPVIELTEGQRIRNRVERIARGRRLAGR